MNDNTDSEHDEVEPAPSDAGQEQTALPETMTFLEFAAEMRRRVAQSDAEHAAAKAGSAFPHALKACGDRRFQPLRTSWRS